LLATFTMTRHLPYDRAERVADAVYQLVAEVMQRDLADPRLSGVSVTRVRMTKDLRTARIYYHLAAASQERKEAARRGMTSAGSFLRRRIAEEITLKAAPEVVFFYDDAVDVEERVDELLAGIKGGSADA
jgi:ribosome-binding factor A